MKLSPQRICSSAAAGDMCMNFGACIPAVRGYGDAYLWYRTANVKLRMVMILL
jgi:hypothetical protein